MAKSKKVPHGPTIKARNLAKEFKWEKPSKVPAGHAKNR